MKPISFGTLVVFGAVALFVSQADAGQRYFYSKGPEAYFCQKPTSYTVGCYAVCDDVAIVKIGAYPTISTPECHQNITRCHPSVAKPCPPRHCPDKCPPTGCLDHTGPCWPRLSACNITSEIVEEPITGMKGRLRVRCDKIPFYRAIVPVTATIPVPQIAIIERETVGFDDLHLEYDCDEYGDDCKDLNCKFNKHCDNCCVDTCQIVKRCTQCTLNCEWCLREGKVLIAVRRPTTPGGTLVADVVIGAVGKATFPEYPENMVLLRAATASQISGQLGINIDLTALSGPTDIKVAIGG